MNLTRRDFLKAASMLSAGFHLSGFRAMASPYAGQVKIIGIKTMQRDNVGDGCLIKIKTDAELVGFGEAGITSKAARSRIEMMGRTLIGQDPLSIERHFFMMTATQYSFMAHIPTISGIDIALWDLAGKIMGQPIYKLLGGPSRDSIPVASHGGPRNMLDPAECKDWAQKIRSAPEGFTVFKFAFPAGIGDRQVSPYNATLDATDFRRVAKAYSNLRAALGDHMDIAMHATGQFDTRSSIGLAKAIEPIDPLWFEDPLNVNYSEAWLELKRSTRCPLLAGEKVEMVRGFRPLLDNQVLDTIQPDISYAGRFTGCKKTADYAALTRTPVSSHSGPCSLIRFYASAHMAAAIQNFFYLENALGEFRGFKEKMAAGREPAVRKPRFPVSEGPGLGLTINEDWLKQHVSKDDTYWA